MDAEKRPNPAQRRADAKFPKSPIGVASRYLKCLDDLEPCGFILHGRVSSGDQSHSGNMAPQIDLTRRAAEAKGFRFIDQIEEVGPGWREGLELNRYRLKQSIELAKKHNAIVLFESTDRAIRSCEYNGQTNPGAWPTELDFNLLMELAGDVVLATVVHPDTPWEKVRGYQSQRGQQGKGNSGGRPKSKKPGYKKAFRDEKEPHVLTQGIIMELPLREISENTDVPVTTAKRWIDEHKRQK